jgi:hypothetical protein
MINSNHIAKCRIPYVQIDKGRYTNEALVSQSWLIGKRVVVLIKRHDVRGVQAQAIPDGTDLGWLALDRRRRSSKLIAHTQRAPLHKAHAGTDISNAIDEMHTYIYYRKKRRRVIQS